LLRVKRYLDEISSTVGALMQVAEGIEEQDKRAQGHCKRLAIMVLELGSAMGCDDWQLTALERAAYLHDIGKAAIPGAIVTKTDTLTPREMQIMRSHCLQGERLCRDVAALKPVLPIIRHHHERVNGSGYPDALRGSDIPILAQILTIPDIYDALRMWRPYRPAMNEAQAVNVMQEEVVGGLWNRQIFDVFVRQVLPGLDKRLQTYDALWAEG
jgi:putative two-component system response regulator